MVIEPTFGTFGSVGRCQVLLENEISISIKLKQKEAWSALIFPGRWLRWLWTSENTVDQHQQMTWQPKSSLTVETSHGTSSNMDSVPLHSSSRLWDLDFQMKCKIYFHLKRGLWTTEQQSNFFLSVNFACNMLWYSTPWTAPPFSNDPLWLTLFVEGINDRLLDHCQVSSVPHYCGFKEQEIPRMYTVWMLIYWHSNVNILIFCDTDFFYFH